MAHCELQQVTDDVWSDDLWGVTESKVIVRKSLTATEDPAKTTSLYFYWGENDRWVANNTRDAIIAKRAKTSASGPDEELKPVMEVDTHALPHAFTLVGGGADVIAGKIVRWVQGLKSDS